VAHVSTYVHGRRVPGRVAAKEPGVARWRGVLGWPLLRGGSATRRPAGSREGGAGRAWGNNAGGGLGAALVALHCTSQRPRPGANDGAGRDDPGGRLAAYEERTQTPLDLLALATLWIVVVPATDFSTAHDVRAAVLAVQGLIRLVYAIDIT